MSDRLAVVPEFQDTFERPAWWHKEQWLNARPVRCQPHTKVEGEFLEWARAREGVTSTATAAPALTAPQPPSATPKSAKTAFTYLLGIDGSPLVKIGHTTATPQSRMAKLQTGQPMQLSLLWSCEGAFESELHLHFSAFRVRGEWFDLTPLGDPIDVVKAAVGEIEVSRT